MDGGQRGHDFGVKETLDPGPYLSQAFRLNAISSPKLQLFIYFYIKYRTILKLEVKKYV